jgi:hypothetical protein
VNGVGAHLVAVDEEHDAIGEDRAEFCKPRVALRRGDSGGDGAAGEGLQPKQHPHRVVGDVEDEAAVGCEGQGDARPFGFVGGQTGTGGKAREDQGRRQEQAGSAEHVGYHTAP